MQTDLKAHLYGGAATIATGGLSYLLRKWLYGAEYSTVTALIADLYPIAALSVVAGAGSSMRVAEKTNLRMRRTLMAASIATMPLSLGFAALWPYHGTVPEMPPASQPSTSRCYTPRCVV